MNQESNWIIGRQAIGDYAGVSVSVVTAMIKAGLQCCGGKRKGLEPRSKPKWIDDFFEKNPNFVARNYLKKKKPAKVKVL